MEYHYTILGSICMITHSYLNLKKKYICLIMFLGCVLYIFLKILKVKFIF